MGSKRTPWPESGLRFALLAGLGLAITACQGTRFLENPPYPAGAPEAGYRYDKLASHSQGNSEELFVILTFSGGGTRAAALSYGVLEKLRRTTIEVEGQRRSLLQEVDVISSNSGGSYTAAYYGLFRDQMFEDGPAGRRFTEKFLYRDIEGAIFNAVVFNPLNWFRLLSTTFNRSDLAAELYDKEIFARKTYSDLLLAGRPYVIINANDTTKGARFEFTQDQFDLICSELADYPLARAVMASSAVHGVFGAVRLVNYDSANCTSQVPDWIAEALGEAKTPPDRGDLDTNRQRYKRARVARSYLEKDNPGAEYYVHLADGGTVDNLGLRAPLLALRSTDPSWSVLGKLNLKEVKKILILSVNAASEPDTDQDQDVEGPGPVKLIAAAISGAIDTITLGSIDQTKNKVQERMRSLKAIGWDAELFGPVMIDFEHIANEDQRRCFKNIKTSLKLKEATVDALRQIAHNLVRDSKGFKDFLAAVNGQQESTPPVSNDVACPSTS